MANKIIGAVILLSLALIFECIFDIVPSTIATEKPGQYSNEYFICIAHHRTNMRDLGLCFYAEATYPENIICSGHIQDLCQTLTHTK